ncbi:hypothetical protein IT411_03215 [Candidatus Peregrinibacteria bacterium]|nr:hypothetical protein [Candidatus Peregrinibacteria bacterium]
MDKSKDNNLDKPESLQEEFKALPIESADLDELPASLQELLNQAEDGLILSQHTKGKGGNPVYKIGKVLSDSGYKIFALSIFQSSWLQTFYFDLQNGKRFSLKSVNLRAEEQIIAKQHPDLYKGLPADYLDSLKSEAVNPVRGSMAVRVKNVLDSVPPADDLDTPATEFPKNPQK